MSPQFKNIAIVGKYQSQGVAEPLVAIASYLKASGYNPIVEKDTADNIGLAGYATAAVA